MSASVTIKLSKKSVELIEAYRHAPAVMADAIADGLGVANLMALSRIQRTRFSGTGPFPVSQNRLGIVTETLRKSLRSDPPEIVDIDRLRIKTAMGSAVRYFGVHELGFSGPVSVRQHSRTRGSSTHSVSAHTRTMNRPARKPLRAGLESDEVQKIYRDQIEKSLVRDLTNLT